MRAIQTLIVLCCTALAGCNANQGVQRAGTKEGTRDTVRSSVAAVHNETRQGVATSQPVNAPVGGVHLGGGTTVNNGTGDVWTGRVSAWLTIAGAWASQNAAILGVLVFCAWWSRFQARKHGYDAGRRKRLQEGPREIRTFTDR